MTQATSLSWFGTAFEHAIDADGRLPYSLLRNSRFALVAAERLEELPVGIASHPLVATRFEASAHLMPRLVDLHSLEDSARGRVVEALDECHARGEHPFICALLVTDASPDVIADHLRRAQSRVQGTRAGWQRIHDPYVFVQLPRVLGPQAMRSLFGPVRQWALCIGAQWWMASLMQDSTSDTRIAGQSQRSPQALWDGLLRIAAVNRALRQCSWTTLPQTLQHSVHLDELAARAAAQHALDGPAEQAAYAALGAQLRLDFDEHPAIAAAIARYREDRAADPTDDGTLVDTLRALPKDIWREVHQSHALISESHV